MATNYSPGQVDAQVMLAGDSLRRATEQLNRAVTALELSPETHVHGHSSWLLLQALRSARGRATQLDFELAQLEGLAPDREAE